jgi:type IV secretory pathway VirB2 component (pilin)
LFSLLVLACGPWSVLVGPRLHDRGEEETMRLLGNKNFEALLGQEGAWRHHRKSPLAGLFFFLVLLLPCLALADAGTPAGLGSITTKMEQIRSLCRVCAGIIVGIGAIWSGVKFIKGDHDSWGYVWKFGLGAVLVFAAGDIVTWLGGSGVDY